MQIIKLNIFLFWYGAYRGAYYFNTLHMCARNNNNWPYYISIPIYFSRGIWRLCFWTKNGRSRNGWLREHLRLALIKCAQFWIMCIWGNRVRMNALILSHILMVIIFCGYFFFRKKIISPKENTNVLWIRFIELQAGYTTDMQNIFPTCEKYILSLF